MLINPYALAPAAGGGSDPFFADVGLLILGGQDGSHNAVDSSVNAFSLTGPSNNACFIASGGPFSGSSPYIDLANAPGGSSPGFGIYVPAIASTGPLDLSAGDYTVEGFFFPRSVTSWCFIGRDNFADFIIGVTSGGLRLIVDNSNVFLAAPINVNAWNHVALVMQSNAYVGYANGVAAAAPVAVSRASWVGSTLSVGGSGSFGNLLPGGATNVRVTKGIPRYLANFTPPTAPFPNS